MNRGLLVTTAICLLVSCLLAASPTPGWGTDLTVSGNRDMAITVTQSGTWGYRLRFNSPVFPNDLAKAVTVKEDQTPCEVELRDPRDDSKPKGALSEFRVVPVKKPKEQNLVHISVAQGLSDASGRWVLARDQTFNFWSTERIELSSLNTFYRTKADKGLQLHFSTEVSDDDARRAIKIVPEVPGLTVTKWGYAGIRVTGDFTFKQEYELEVSAVRTEKSSGLFQEARFPFSGPGLEHNVAFRSSHSVVELRGRQLLPVTLTNITKTRCVIKRIPPYFVPEMAAVVEQAKAASAERTRTVSRAPQGGIQPRRMPPRPPRFRGAGVPQGPDEDSQETTPVDLQMEQRTKLLKALADSGSVSRSYLVPFSEEAEVFFAPEGSDKTIGYSLPLSFRRNPDHGGAWLVDFQDPDNSFKGPRPGFIQVTDISLTYKRAERSILLWVTALNTGEPVPGVELMLATSDGAKFFPGKTDTDGLLLVKNGAESLSVLDEGDAAKPQRRAIDISKITSAVAATDTDSCAINLGSDHIKPLGVQQTAKAQAGPSKGNGQIFTERGIYRPGETVFFKFVSRNYKDNKVMAIPGKKVKVEITGPTQDVIYSKEMDTNDFGSFNDSVPIKGFFPVGTYTITARTRGPARGHKDKAQPEVEQEARPGPGEDQDPEEQPTRGNGTPGRQKSALGTEKCTTTFLVAEFKRPRHMVKLATKMGSRKGTDFIRIDREEEYLSVDIQALYYTGGPVKHAKVRWKATLVPVKHAVAGMDGYLFGNEDDSELFSESGEGVLDKNGKHELAVPLDPRLLTGIYGVRVSATVLDVDGEPATEVITFNPKPKFLVGIANHPKEVATGYKSGLKVIVVASDGKPVKNGRVTADFMHQEGWNTQKRDDDGNLNYTYEEGWVKALGTSQPLVDGQAVFDVAFNTYGRHMIVFTYSDGSGNYSSQTVFKVGWDAYESWISAKKREGVVTGDSVFLAMKKDEYEAGEKVDVEFNTRRPVNKCLVTLERDDILFYQVVDVKGTVGKYSFTTSEKFLPNVYVSVIAPAGRSGFPVYRAQVDTDVPLVYSGYADVKVKDRVDKLRVQIAPGKVELKGRPGEKAEVAFKVTDSKDKGVVAEMAVCVVDEAVLALTRFTTPDLSGLTDFDLPLSVFSGDLRLSLISQDLYRIFSTKPLTGGGGGDGAVVSSLRKDFRPVAYFNPALVTNEAGEAKIEFKLPDTTTQYRIYVVACDKGSGFASDQRNMLIAKEFFVEPSVPRFLIPGDKITFPAVLNNKTDSKGQFSLNISGSKNLTLKLSQKDGEMDPWSSLTVKAMADVVGGQVEAKVRCSGEFKTPSGRFDDAIEQTFPIHSRYLPVNRALMGSFTQQTVVPVDLPAVLKTMKPDGLTDDDFQARLTLSLTPWSKIAPGMKYLLQYPYGCIEQTSSGIIPLAGIRSLAKAGKVPGISVEQVDKYLGPGLERLLSMQLGGGGFSYWPGGVQPSWWGTLYATFAMSMLKHEAGFEVPEDRLKMAVKYLRDNLFEADKTDWLHSYNWIRELAVLNMAQNNALNQAEFQTFFSGYDTLSNQGKAYLILAAEKLKYLPQGRLASLVAKLDPKINPTMVNYDNSSYREIAVCLLAAVATNADRSKQDTWAGYLLKGLKPEGRWYSTADTGWCLLALSKYFQSRESAGMKSVKCKVDVKGKGVQEVQISDVPAEVELDAQALLTDGKIKLETGSDTLVNYTISRKYPDLMTDPAKLNAGFILNKRMENLNGKEEIRVGDVLRITLEFELPRSTTGNKWGQVEYLVLEDPVPAGVVPINTELATEGASDSKKAPDERSYDYVDDMHPTHFEFRDDGTRVFKNRVWTGRHRYSYLARAVSEGEFWMRGSRVSLMYDPDVFGKTLGRKVSVLPAQ